MKLNLSRFCAYVWQETQVCSISASIFLRSKPILLLLVRSRKFISFSVDSCPKRRSSHRNLEVARKHETNGMHWKKGCSSINFDADLQNCQVVTMHVLNCLAKLRVAPVRILILELENPNRGYRHQRITSIDQVRSLCVQYPRKSLNQSQNDISPRVPR